MSPTQAERESGFLERLESHRGIVERVTRLYARTAADREDLAAEIVAALWQSFPRFDPTRRFSTWAYRVALNVAISFARAGRRDAGRRSDPGTALFDVPQPVDVREPALERLDEFIVSLRDVDRALMLLYLERFSYGEIASTLGLSESNVGTKLGRLKERARATLARPTAS